MHSSRLIWLIVLGVFVSNYTWTQTNIDWATKSKSHRYYLDSRSIPAKDGWFAIEGSIEGENIKEISVYDPVNFGNVKLHSLTSEKKKDKDFYRTGAASIGGDIYKYDAKTIESINSSTTILECISADKQDITVNQVTNPEGKDVVVNHSAVSSAGKYSVIYTSTVLGKTFRDGLSLVPYLGIPFMYFKKRDPEFYVRPNVFTVFDANGEVAWTKSYTMGEGDTACYINSVEINDLGTVFIHATASPIRNHYFDMKNRSVGSIGMKGPMRAHRIYSISKNESAPTRLDFEEKDTEDYAFSTKQEKYFFSGNEYLRVATIEVAARTNGILDKYDEWTFGGFTVKNLNSHKVPTVFIPVGLFDLQQSITKKENRKLEKGDAIEIGLPEVRGVHLSSKDGVFLFIEQTNFDVLAGARHEYSFENLVVLNSDFKGQINWSELIPQKQEVWKSHSNVGGFHMIYHKGDFLIIQNDSEDGEVWKGGSDEVVWIRKMNAKADVVGQYKMPAAKNILTPRRTFVNLDGELIFIADKPVGDIHLGDYPKKETTVVGRLKL